MPRWRERHSHACVLSDCYGEQLQQGGPVAACGEDAIQVGSIPRDDNLPCAEHRGAAPG